MTTGAISIKITVYEYNLQGLIQKYICIGTGMNKKYDVNNFTFFKGRDLKYGRDNLTGVLAREEIISYVRHLIEKNVPFSFAMVDIDNFKMVNDTLGHQKGDRVLSMAAQYLCEKVGSAGVVGRFGGDEFLIVFENMTEYKDVWTVGHEINMNIGALRFGEIKGLSITVTMGISRFPLDASTYDELVALADKALYRGKMKGRNCFIIYLPEKHKDIDITKERERKYTSTHLCARVFHYLTCSEDISEGIALLIKQFVSYFMVDHMCIQTRKGINFEVIHNLSKNKQFVPIDYDGINAYFNNLGLVYFNKVEDMREEDYTEILRDLRAQHISSALYCKISAFGEEYGFVRVDITYTVRIWQSTEMDLITITAHLIGVLLHYQGKTLDDLPRQDVFIMATEPD